MEHRSCLNSERFGAIFGLQGGFIRVCQRHWKAAQLAQSRFKGLSLSFEVIMIIQLSELGVQGSLKMIPDDLWYHRKIHVSSVY